MATPCSCTRFFSGYFPTLFIIVVVVVDDDDDDDCAGFILYDS